jgi:hypothetical protein
MSVCKTNLHTKIHQFWIKCGGSGVECWRVLSVSQSVTALYTRQPVLQDLPYAYISSGSDYVPRKIYTALKNFFFWYITACSPLRLNQRFDTEQAEYYLLYIGFILAFFRPWRWRRHVPPKRLYNQSFCGKISHYVTAVAYYYIDFLWSLGYGLGRK